MIARLSGILEEKTPDQLVIDVSGVGYQVFVSLQTFYRLPALHERVNLHVYTHLREDALQLYGFLEEKEKMTFLLLKGVTGIGPRLALNILSGIPVDELEGALRGSDVTRLVAVPGVGRKTAERLVVELREKVGAVENGQLGIPGEPTPLSAEAVSALVNLGYRRTEAEKAVRDALRRGVTAIADLIRESLRSLSA
ncbi:MAG TPA: Holliday junction branch migration protein RuvA [Candidatus Binatia bacterium]|nr:Holliday junction branch migration protein RuvA [Candidatus Binatia bacterium]